MADPNWEFNCPQYVDFSRDNLYAEDDGADTYFDFDHENGIPIHFSDSTSEHEAMDVEPGPSESLVTTLQNDNQRITRAMVRNTPKIIESPRRVPTPAQEQKNRSSKSLSCTPSVAVGEESNENESQKIISSQTKDTPMQTEINHDSDKSREEEKKVSNICTNLEDWNKRKQDQSRVETGQKRRRSVSFSELEPDRKTRANKPLQRSGSMKVQRRSAGQFSDGSSQHNVGEVGRSRSGSESKIARPSPKRYKCTITSTPTFMKRQPLIQANGVKKSEDLELEKIQYFRTQLQQKRELAQKSMKVALSQAPPLEAHHAAKEPTKPMEFQFETDKRVKKHGMETRADLSVKDFAHQLRSNQAHQKEGPKGPTKPMPFSFDEKQKRKLDGSEESLTQKFESMAEKVTAFHKATPERFRSAPKGSVPKRGLSSPPVLTVPHTPNLETRSRSRPVTVQSQKELEEMEIEEMKRYQFRAHPLNTKIFTEQPCIKHSEKEPTRPEEFDLHTDRRIQTRETIKHDTEEHYEFHAQPVPRKILEGPVGLKPAKPMPVTNPKSPAFALKHRARLPTRTQPEPEEEEKIIRANPVPHAGIPFQPSLEHKATVLQPFTFDERDKLLIQKKEEKIQEILEEEKRARDFVANPLPNLSPDVLPPKKVKPPTRPESPHLKIDARGAKRAAEWKAKNLAVSGLDSFSRQHQKGLQISKHPVDFFDQFKNKQPVHTTLMPEDVEEQLNREREAAIFKALPSTVVHKEPFLPKKSTKVLTEVSNVELSTVKRAMQREAFDIHRKAQEAELEAAKRHREKEKEEEEREAIEKLRQEAVHKANPIKRYKPVEVKRSSKPCTVPLSPKFKTDERLHSSRNLNLSNA